MCEAGVLAHDAHIELLDGELFERLVSMKPPHASAVVALDDLLRKVVGDRAHVRCRLPVTLGDFSEPEPDFALTSGDRSLFKTRHPYAEDVLAIIEVSYSSRDFDIRRKVPIYARYGIPEVLVVDLVDSCFRIFRHPVGTDYVETRIVNGGEHIALLAFPNSSINVRDVIDAP